MASEPADRVESAQDSTAAVTAKSANTALKSRVEQLETTVKGLSGTVDTLSRVLQKMIVNQQMAAAVPKIAAVVQSQMEVQLGAPGGMEAWAAGPATPPG